MKMSIKLSANVLGYCIFSIILTIHIGIGTYFIYYKYMNSDKKKASANGGSIFQTTIY